MDRFHYKQLLSYFQPLSLTWTGYEICTLQIHNVLMHRHLVIPEANKCIVFPLDEHSLDERAYLVRLSATRMTSAWLVCSLLMISCRYITVGAVLGVWDAFVGASWYKQQISRICFSAGRTQAGLFLSTCSKILQNFCLDRWFYNKIVLAFVSIKYLQPCLLFEGRVGVSYIRCST